jgi:hypothetical protein
MSQYTTGYATSEFGSILVQAQDLCATLGHSLETPLVWRRLWVYRINRADTRGAVELGGRLLRWGREHAEIRWVADGLQIAGWSTAVHGRLAAARTLLERAADAGLEHATGWDQARGATKSTLRGCWHAYLGLVSAWTGYLAQALAHAASLKDAAKVSQWPDWTAESQWFRIRILHFLFDPADLIEDIEKLNAFSHEHDLRFFGTAAKIFRGYDIARRGDPAGGRAILAQGLAAYDATEAVLWTRWFRALLAETHLMLGETDEALNIIAATLATRTGERCYSAELHRLLGETHRMRGDLSESGRCFNKALSVARSQRAKLWELRAATSNARLLRDQGKPADAHALLAPIYAWFTEGFDTTPLKDAKALLDGLVDAGG